VPIILLLAAAAAPVPPRPSKLEVYRDWTVGCDNGRTCQAVALMPDGDPEGGVTMAVRRGAEPEARPEVDFALDATGAVALAADGKRLPVRLVARPQERAVAPADVPAVIAALRSARTLSLLDAKGGSLGGVSLAGASAALLYMDDQQKRIGTVTALARPGPKPASIVPPPPPLPVVRAAPAGSGPVIVLGAARTAALRKQQGCVLDDVGGPDTVETFPLDPERTLVLLACGSGAYNVSIVPLIAQRAGGEIGIQRAPFDAPKDWWEDGKPVLINADWDPKKRLLSSYAKARGLGDCGVMQDYAWDGARFRLVHQEEMGECRGSIDYITTWRAQVVRP
jgi:hypothetical protein